MPTHLSQEASIMSENIIRLLVELKYVSYEGPSLWFTLELRRFICIADHSDYNKVPGLKVFHPLRKPDVDAAANCRPRQGEAEGRAVGGRTGSAILPGRGSIWTGPCRTNKRTLMNTGGWGVRRLCWQRVIQMEKYGREAAPQSLTSDKPALSECFPWIVVLFVLTPNSSSEGRVIANTRWGIFH